jgi:hypothetical protein
MAVATPDAFVFVYVHDDLRPSSLTNFMMIRTDFSSQKVQGSKKTFVREVQYRAHSLYPAWALVLIPLDH